MKKTFKFFAAALAIVVAASCAKESANTNNEKTSLMTFSASIDPETAQATNDTPQVKTSLNTENKAVHWSDNDAIGVFYKDRNYLKFNGNSLSINPESNNEDPTYATFSGNVVSSNTYYAVHPAKGWNVQSGSTDDYLCFDGLRSQNAVLNSFDSDKHISLTKSTSGDHFDFVNACALAKVKISGFSNVYSIKIDGNVTSSGNGAYTEGSIGGNLWFKQNEAVVYRAIKNNSHNSIILSNADGSPLQDGGTYYIVLPVCKIGNFKLSLLDKNGGELQSISKASEFNVERNKIYNLGEIEKKYSVVKQLSYATELEDGKLYVISYMKDTKMFWYEDEMYIKLKSFSSDKASDNKFETNNVFKYHKTSQNASIGNYNTTTVGMWESLSNGKYMSTNPAMNGNSNNASYISIGQWDGKSKDFDMYIGTSSSNTLYYNGTRVATGSISTAEASDRGQQARKWYIYEVE